MNLLSLPDHNFSLFCVRQKGYTSNSPVPDPVSSKPFLSFINYIGGITKRLALVLLLSTALLPVFSQDTAKNPEKELAYTKAINERAEKIVATLGISDAAKAKRVTGIIAGQYRNLNDIYTLRDTKVKAVKAQTAASKEEINNLVKKAEDDATAKVDILHKTYLSSLSKELTPEQVDKVKDGMTYDVLHVTYKGYNEMILNLTDEQKKQIMTWLIEAREHAMDAESADKKHAWFGKYKGRINNYLSAAGYDLNKEGKEWEKRRNSSKSAAAN